MKKNYVIILLYALILSSCGCGFSFLYNWRPKPWTHHFIPDTYTGLDTLIHINGYYVSPPVIDTTYYTDASMGNITKKKTDYFETFTKIYSIMYYNNGLCIALSTRHVFTKDNVKSILDTFYSNHFCQTIYNRHATSWGTYEIHNDTIKTFLIEDLSGCDGVRKNISTQTHLISDNQQLKHTFISNSNKDYGYKKTLDIPYCKFYHIEEKRDSTKCPYLTKKWFYKQDKE